MVFFLALRIFIARRGRPKVIYSDNGTNFVGADNLFKSLDWSVIEIESSIKRIQWYFCPPAAPWWGGFWEIMVKLIKTLLRKVLGRSSLNYEELQSVLIDCESELTEVGVPDLDNIDRVNLKRRFRYQQNLRKDLRKRFDEYLGKLVMRPSKVKGNQRIAAGDIVLIETEGKKKVLWPMGRVTETSVNELNMANLNLEHHQQPLFSTQLLLRKKLRWPIYGD
ncbi:uncharacterized protein [Parasteatoda tepidariorum]|uniref:uncharacterized protein n=1 Tax=Parasteatoda tepidariorum TaxID=114398 RepID=UPI0039BC7973